MKTTVNLSRLMACSLLVLSSHATAAYTQSISDCSITKLGTNKWRAKFNLTVSDNGTAKSVENTFYAEVPSTLDTYGIVNPKNNVLTTWSNVVVSANLRYAAGPRYLAFIGLPSDPNIIKFSSPISIDFTTDAQGAYPGLRTYHTMDYGLGGGVVNIRYVSASGCQISIAALPKPEEVDPPEPEFSMKSALWELNAVDVSDLPDVAATGNGYAASIKNIASNSLCINYVTAGVKNKTYALSVSNTSSTQGGRNLFMLQGPTSQLFYNLKLASNTGGEANDFSFPAASVKYITLTQAASSMTGRSEMCWTPKINLFKNTATKEGMHSSTVNFVISPKA